MRLPVAFALTGLWVLLFGFALEPLTAVERTVFVCGVLVPCVPFVLVTRERRR